MNMNCEGRVNITTPGTPVALSVEPAARASKLLFQAVPGIAGKIYIGVPGMIRTTFAGCARVLAPSETFAIEAEDGANSIRLVDYVVDADIAGDGVLVTYWTE